MDGINNRNPHLGDLSTFRGREVQQEGLGQGFGVAGVLQRDGRLTIAGTAGDDDITIDFGAGQRIPEGQDHAGCFPLTVRMGKQQQTIYATEEELRNLTVAGGDGKDQIKFHGRMPDFMANDAAPLVHGGDGEDIVDTRKLTGGSVRFIGGGGQDRFRGALRGPGVQEGGGGSQWLDFGFSTRVSNSEIQRRQQDIVSTARVTHGDSGLDIRFDGNHNQLKIRRAPSGVDGLHSYDVELNGRHHTVPQEHLEAWLERVAGERSAAGEGRVVIDGGTEGNIVDLVGRETMGRLVGSGLLTVQSEEQSRG